jgi:putative SOS response-associated peptidase YedK
VTDPLQVERLLQPYPEDAMRVYAVSTDVNSTRNNGPDLIEPDEGAEVTG